MMEMQVPSWRGNCVVELPLGQATATFNLERAVCSHGLFMMSPNHWDPLTKTLLRPLHLSLSHGEDKPSNSVLVRISHPQSHPHSLRLQVLGTPSLSPLHQQALLVQVRRMFRLSEADEENVREFEKMMNNSGEEGEAKFISRVFRSPTLFEDMVKCILLCNCQWSRTLSMAKALCDLQLELHCRASTLFVAQAGDTNSEGEAKTEQFIPKTPAAKESKRKFGVHKISTNLTNKFSETKADLEADDNLREDCSSCQNSNETNRDGFCSLFDSEFSNGIENNSLFQLGNFPSPTELASLNETFLEKRCNLGYRASRIVKLAQSVVEGRIQLEQLDKVCANASLSSYERLMEQLKGIHGFGPFTCANVLMCMGFYHKIPTDTETIRHIKQVHGRKSTIKTVERDAEKLYEKYAPFQFLAYWSELWHFYETRFGKFSEMPHSDYKLVTASNMRTKGRGKRKRT